MANSLKSYYLAKSIPIQKLKGRLPFIEVSFTREIALYRINEALIYVYSFGSVTFVDISDADEKLFISELSKVIPVKGKPVIEEYSIVRDATMKGFLVSSENAIVKNPNKEVVWLIARVIAQSVALEDYEDEFGKVSHEFLRLNYQLSANGKIKMKSRRLLMMIARNNLVMEEIISGIGVLDKPDITWNNQFLDALYTKLTDEFEIEERFQSLKSKMGFVQENYNVFLESLRGRYDARLEWIIIILIAFEILLFSFEIFFL